MNVQIDQQPSLASKSDTLSSSSQQPQSLLSMISAFELHSKLINHLFTIYSRKGSTSKEEFALFETDRMSLHQFSIFCRDFQLKLISQKAKPALYKKLFMKHSVSDSSFIERGGFISLLIELFQKLDMKVTQAIEALSLDSLERFKSKLEQIGQKMLPVELTPLREPTNSNNSNQLHNQRHHFNKSVILSGSAMLSQSDESISKAAYESENRQKKYDGSPEVKRLTFSGMRNHKSGELTQMMKTLKQSNSSIILQPVRCSLPTIIQPSGGIKLEQSPFKKYLKQLPASSSVKKNIIDGYGKIFQLRKEENVIKGGASRLAQQQSPLIKKKWSFADLPGVDRWDASLAQLSPPKRSVSSLHRNIVYENEAPATFISLNSPLKKMAGLSKPTFHSPSSNRLNTQGSKKNYNSNVLNSGPSRFNDKETVRYHGIKLGNQNSLHGAVQKVSGADLMQQIQQMRSKIQSLRTSQ